MNLFSLNLLHLRSQLKKERGTGGSSARLEYLVWDQGVAGSNPVLPTEIFANASKACKKSLIYKLFCFFPYQIVAKNIKCRVNKKVNRFANYICVHKMDLKRLFSVRCKHDPLISLSSSSSFFRVSREQNSEKELITQKMIFMRSSNTFGVHFTLRTREQNGKHPVYARITVNKTRCELSLKQYLYKKDWSEIKGIAKPKNEELKQLNSYLEEIRGKLVHHYRELLMQDKEVTAEIVKDVFVGKKEKVEEKAKKYSLLWLVKHHNDSMKVVLKKGTMKNYFTTEKYLKNFLKMSYHKDDLLLKDLTYEFITAFEFFVRTHAVKKNDPCTNNGTMKHLERLKKIVAWAVKNEWIDKNPFIGFQLKFKRSERDFLQVNELAAIEAHEFDNPMLQKVRDFFVFSCYTGLAYIDVTELKPQNIIGGIDGTKWIKTSRAKTDTSVNVPLLKPALIILEKYLSEKERPIRETIFPWISNQEINRSLKIIAEVCSIKKHFTFHLARHTFATTVTLINGVPIESISKMLGHTKLSTTMIYAKVTQSKIGSDMQILQNKLDALNSNTKMKAV